MIDLSNKKAIITGAGSGIGKAVSIQLAKQGAEVILFDKDIAGVQLTQQSIQAVAGNVSIHEVDVTDERAIDELVNRFENIDILVNCAGISHIGNVINTTANDFDKIFNVNVKGIFNCMKAVIPKMKEKKHGVIINISSIAAKVGLQDRFAYSMSKGAVHAMTLSVAKDFIKDGIRCNSIAPARIHTPFVDGFLQKNYPGKEKEMFDKLAASQPIGRMGTPEEVAYQVAYLCSDEASFITGSDFSIDGGFVTLNN